MMANNPKRSNAKTVLTHLGLILLASLLFALSFPNLLIKNGLSFLAWFSYIPVLLVIYNNSLLSCAGWGAIYGYTAYTLFNYWLSVFHPLAGIIVGTIYLFYMAVLFVLLKLAVIYFPRRFYIVQWIIWVAYEYLRTTGFLGYSYGITAYSQWRMIPLIQIASITGVWGVSALVTFPSFWLAAVGNREWGIGNGERSSKAKPDSNTHRLVPPPYSLLPTPFLYKIKAFFRSEKLPVIIWLTALAASLIFGFVSIKGYSKASPAAPKAHIALIQHNTDPWLPSKAPTRQQALAEYRKDMEVLIRLSDEALAAVPRPDMVVWPETAFVPRIYWHQTYRDDQDSWALVRELLEYLSAKDTPFVIGNDDAYKDPKKNRIDYNAALLFENGIITNTYRKLHLVPFTEHFPYKKQLPFIYKWLENADTHFWEKGTEATVFQGPGFTFSTPICFEDTFGYLSRDYVRRGADILVNLTNDAWANSLPSQNQHLSMAVFRAVENHRPMVRSTVSGQTCAITPFGKVTALAPPFTEAWINVIVPIVKKDTFYTLYGDYIAITFTITAVILLLFGIISGIIRTHGQS